MIRASGKDKWKKQHTRPTEVAAYGVVAAEAREEGLSLGRYIRQCREINESRPSPSVFDLCSGAVSRYETKMRLELITGYGSRPALFSVEFGVLGNEA